MILLISVHQAEVPLLWEFGSIPGINGIECMLKKLGQWVEFQGFLFSSLSFSVLNLKLESQGDLVIRGLRMRVME